MASAISFVLTWAVTGSLGQGVPSVLLQNSVNGTVYMPAAGMGTGCAIGGCTWTEPGANLRAYNMTKSWFAIGGRRIDDADSYGLAQGIGKAIKDAGMQRQDVFLTSKTGPGGLPYPLGFNETVNQAREICANYSTSYVDLLLIHWPVNYGPCSYHGPRPSIPTTDPACDTALPSYSDTACRLSTWRGMLRVLELGLARAVGVSNFNTTHLEEIRAAGLPMPSVNQVQFSPLHNLDTHGCSPYSGEACRALIQYCHDHKIVFNSYSPFGGSGRAKKLLNSPKLLQIAHQHNTTAAQVVLAWQWFGHSMPVNPEAVNPIYQKENLYFFDVDLTRSDIAELDAWQSTHDRK